MNRFRRLIIIVSVMGASLACSQPKTLSDYDCSYEQDIARVNDAAKEGAIFLFGERHGTNEAPSFVADFACKMAIDTQEPLIVLLELPIPDVLSDLSVENMSIEDAKNLIVEEGIAYWSSKPDGRTSIAMMEAILKILHLREQGLDVALGSMMTYEGAPDIDYISEHFDVDLSFVDEQILKKPYFKETIRILKNKNKFKNVIVMSGNVHTKGHLRYYNRMKVDMPYLGFMQAYGGGTEWNRQNILNWDNVEVKVGVHETIPFHKNLAETSDDASLVLMQPGEAPEWFDGVFIFKTVSASPPYFEENNK